jgi:hypothetical protein
MRQIGVNLDTETRKHDIRVMKNVTITLPDDLARRARIEAAGQDKSLSRFIADLLAERLDAGLTESGKRKVLMEFLDGPGFPGISKAWRGREALYAEREAELLRRYKSSRVRHRSGASRKTAAVEGFSETDYGPSYIGPKSAKPQRVLSRRNRKARTDVKK